MSLSVVLLLSIALMKTFEKRSLEVAQLGHNLDRFQAENLTRSGLKLILFSVKKAGLVTVNAYLEQLKQIEFPLGNGTIKIMEIKPVDHRFNLNTKIKGTEDPRIDVFSSMITASKESSDSYNYLSGESYHEVVSSIIDWTDVNDRRDTIFHFDGEQYPQEEPGFIVKNRLFERISEIRLLPSFRSLTVSADFLEKNFRTTNDSKLKPDGIHEYIDVNISSEADIEQFLARYDGLDKFPNISGRSADISGIIISERSNPAVGTNSGFNQVEPTFPTKNFGKEWTDRLKLEGIIDLSEDEINLFQPHTNHLFIHYQVTVGRVTLDARSMIEIRYVDLNKNLDIQTLKILWFRIS